MSYLERIYKASVNLKMNYVFYVMYIMFLVAACVSVAEESDLDDWISLVTNGALAVTSIYAYTMKRFDLTTISLFAMCSSIVWHSSGKYKQIDSFVSRYIAYYAFGTSAFPVTVIGPAMLFVTVLTSYEEEFDEMYIFIPLVCLLIWYRWKNDTLSKNITLAIIVGVLGILCYRNTAWHSMWHVLGAISVALTMETPERQARFYVKNTPVV